MRSRTWRTTVVFAACALAMGVAGGCTGTAPTPPPVRRADVGPGLRAAVGTVLDENYSGSYSTVRSLVIAVDGNVRAERYRSQAPTATAKVHTVTASVVTTLVGIAIDEGRIAGVDEPLSRLLPDDVGAMATATRDVTLGQLLSMTGGFPADPTGLPPAVVNSQDWVRAILARGPTTAGPHPFAYSAEGAHLLSAVLAHATGQAPLDYARSRLFAPLGIVVAGPGSAPPAAPTARGAGLTSYETTTRFAWLADPHGINLGSGGLRLTARDLLALGQLWLDGGRWSGRQLVSAGWVAQATGLRAATPQRTRFDPVGFGYQFWLLTADGHPAFAAVGADGQVVEVVPDLRVVTVVQAASAPSSQPVPPPRLDTGPTLSHLAFVDTVVAPIVEG